MENEITQEEREAVVFVAAEVSKIGQLDAYQRLKVVNAIMEYALKFRARNGIQAMKDYILWANMNDRKPTRILETIMHDLSGRDDELMEPRTISYLGINNGENTDVA